jgi:hypothetical protein
LQQIFEGQLEGNVYVAFFQTPYWVVDVRDQAIIHIGALLASDVDRQKLWAAGNPPHHINEYLAVWREAYPDKKIVDDFDMPPVSVQHLNRDKENELMRRFGGRDWIPWKETVLETVN